MKLARNHKIEMPHMTNRALSEYWLLKELGDIHWTLLSQGLEQKTSEFKDSVGNRLYATFVRINYSVSHLTNVQENDILSLHGLVKKIHCCTYRSAINGVCNGGKLNANLLIKFTVRKHDDNFKISKGQLEEKVNKIKKSNDHPSLMDQHTQLKKKLLTKLRSGNYAFSVTDNSLDTINYNINPHYEINGVGLLYFACDPIITDKCLSDVLKLSNTVEQYESNYSTIYRDIFDFANCNTNDCIVFKLNTVQKISQTKIKRTTSL